MSHLQGKTMDCRLTIDKNDSFLKMLQAAHISGEAVNLIYDDNGMTRAEGRINTILTDTPEPTIELNTGLKIPVKAIIALNGIFLPEYGEC